ncbi:MAG TPA: Ig-like domain-containing protein [Gemmatimonadaceae bacterium]|nr:Ig-like domain-containing protein [Gemmatimonadaceae bacterium]
MFGTRTSTIRRAPAALALAALLGGCGGTPDAFLTAPRKSAVDTTRPTVVATNPGVNQTGVPTNSLIIVTFSEPVDSASVTNAALSFTGGVTGLINVTGASATLIPNPALPANTTITGTITGIRDRAGNVLAQPYTWTFTTAP